MVARRTYGDSCGIARALDIAGERWALLVARELLLGPKRFTDLRAGLPRVTPDVLAQRLRELEAAGVLRRRTLPPPAAARVYELTEWGAELAPVLVGLGRWGSRAPLPDGAGPLGADAAIVALQSTFDPGAADGVDERYEIRLGERTFRLGVGDGRLQVGEAATDPAVTIDTDTATLAQVVWHGRPLQDAIEAGAMRVVGDADAARRLVGLFAAPVPV